MLKRIEGDLWDWVEYNTRMLENSGLGFAPRTPVARMMEEGGAGSGSYQSRVPFIKNAPAHVRAIDRLHHEIQGALWMLR